MSLNVTSWGQLKGDKRLNNTIANCPCNHCRTNPTSVTTVHQRRRQTDRGTTYDSNTALCTKMIGVAELVQFCVF